MMNCLENGRNPAECVLLANAEKRRELMKVRMRQVTREALLFGLLCGLLIGIVICRVMLEKATKPTPTPQAAETPVIAVPVPIPEVSFMATVTPEPIPAQTPALKPEKVSLGTYRITAYCSCEKCCGEWAKNRPGGIVKGAAGVELKAGVSCASPLPFGTVVEIDGLGEYVVQDRTGTEYAEQNGGKVIDIYFDNHEAALDFGVKYLEVFEKEGVNNDPMQ